jgi:hypothetical protein
LLLEGFGPRDDLAGRLLLWKAKPQHWSRNCDAKEPF